MASPVSGLLGDASAAETKTLEPQQLRARAVESFQTTADRMAEALLSQDARQQAAYAERVHAETRRFSAAIDRHLNELSGDGILTLAEVQTDLKGLRTEYINDLKENLLALKEGAPHPPRRRPDESWLNFTGRQVHYTIAVRNQPKRFLWLVACIAGGIAVAWMTSFAVRKRANERPTADGALRWMVRLRRPIYLALVAAAIATGMTWIWMPIELTVMMQKLLLLAAGVSVLWAIWTTSEVLPRSLGMRELGQHARDLTRTFFRVVGVLLFAAFVIEVIADTDFTALLAGVGVIGFALTLAAQDSLKNLFGAATIHADSLFRVGQLVRFDGYFGTIERIGFRSVKLRTLEGHMVTIPNAKLVAETVENVDARPYIRRFFEIALVYGTSADKVSKAIEIIRDVLGRADFVLEDPPYHVALHELATYSLDLLVTYYHREPDYWKAKENDTELNLAILCRFREQGIEFAVPTHAVHLRPRALRSAVHEADGHDGAHASPRDDAKDETTSVVQARSDS